MRSDLEKVGSEMGLNDCGKIIDDISAVISNWEKFANTAGVTDDQKLSIQEQHRIL